MQEQSEDTDRPTLADYFNYPTADRLNKIKEQIRQHEERHFELNLGKLAIEGNPDQGTHRETAPEGAPCMCGPCEIRRIDNGMESLTYAINQLKALYQTLS